MAYRCERDPRHRVNLGPANTETMPKRLTEAAAADMMREADLEPLVPYPGYKKPWACRCTKCGDDCSPLLASVRKGASCPYCSGQRIRPSDAEQVMRKAGLEPLEPFRGSATPWRCECQRCGKEVSPQYASILNGGGCGYCSGNRLDADQYLAVMREAGLEPLVPYPGRLEPWQCKCAKCGNTVSPMYANVRQGSGCLFCGRREDADEAAGEMLAAGFEPLEPYPGGQKAWRCRCTKCGRKVAPTFNNVRANGIGCAYCSGKRIDSDEARQIALAKGLEPQEPYRNRGPWRMRCLTCEREYSPAFATVRAGFGCPWCTGNRIDPADAERVMRDAGLEPLEPYTKALARWRCRCITCGNVVTPMFASVQNGHGCRYCADRGFNYNEPAVVYLVHSTEFMALKVGITSRDRGTVRLDQHEAEGWSAVELWDVPRGDIAAEVEAAVVLWWRDDLGAPPAVMKSDMRQGGWTETASLIHAEVDETVERITVEIANRIQHPRGR